jgi:hypothetical protein
MSCNAFIVFSLFITHVFVSFYFEGCGFVKYSHRDMAVAAINALNGLFTMRVSVVSLLY